MNPLKNKRIVLGITGSIAAYKAAEIASMLTKSGAIVHAILSEGGTKFITPLAIRSVSGQKAYVDEDLWSGDDHVPHIHLGHEADCILVAPASADMMAQIAGGFGGTLLSVTILAANCPLLIAPAMDGDMYHNPATQSNVQTLQSRGWHLIGPEQGRLASGMTGLGRMSEPVDIVAATRFILSRSKALKGKHILVTAGGTQEPIDPVRVITNRSSGKQGYAIAQAALDEGADVTLITAPTTLPTPYGATVIHVKTAAEMKDAVITATPTADALIMCAAVADFRPVEIAEQKIKKDSQFQSIQLEPTTDILSEIGKNRGQYPKLKFLAGFAAESQDLLENAQKKLSRKNLDMIVANDISSPHSGFEVDHNQATFLYRDGNSEFLPPLTKAALAEEILQRIALQFIE